MPKKDGAKATKTLQVAATPRLMQYLDDLVALEGYGNSRAEVARGFIWKEINRLLEVGRLRQKD